MLVKLILAVAYFGSALCEEEILHPYRVAVDVKVVEKCLKVHSLTRADFPETVSRFSDLPEKQQCFFKCTNEELGILDQNGVIVIDKVREFPVVKMLDEVKREAMLECLGNLEAVKTCQDLAGYQECSVEIME